jgi:hypothetical protein
MIDYTITSSDHRAVMNEERTGLLFHAIGHTDCLQELSSCCFSVPDPIANETPKSIKQVDVELTESPSPHSSHENDELVSSFDTSIFSNNVMWGESDPTNSICSTIGSDGPVECCLNQPRRISRETQNSPTKSPIVIVIHPKISDILPNLNRDTHENKEQNIPKVITQTDPIIDGSGDAGEHVRTDLVTAVVLLIPDAIKNKLTVSNTPKTTGFSFNIGLVSNIFVAIALDSH